MPSNLTPAHEVPWRRHTPNFWIAALNPLFEAALMHHEQLLIRKLEQIEHYVVSDELAVKIHLFAVL